MSEPDVLDELEKYSRRARAEEAKKEKRRAWLRPLGLATRLLVYACLFLALYVFKPDDISQIPFAQLTLDKLGRTVGWIVITLGLIYWLFNPAEDDGVKDAWGWLGMIVLLGVIGASIVVNQWG